MKCLPLLVFFVIAGCLNESDRQAYLDYQASVEGNQITSEGFPTGTIVLESALTYVGRDSFILYDVADCEIHLFAEADENKAISRLFWFQYEAYLPSLIPHRYDYTGDPLRETIGGRPFYASVNAYNTVAAKSESREDSDFMHVFRLLEANGFSFDADVLRLRLVHLDATRKKELMIIYLERLSDQNPPVSLLTPDEKDHLLTEATESFIQRAKAGMEIRFSSE